MYNEECPHCHNITAQYQYGGERGEAGPYLLCSECGYDEEQILKTKNVSKGQSDEELMKELRKYLLKKHNYGKFKRAEVREELLSKLKERLERKS